MSQQTQQKKTSPTQIGILVVLLLFLVGYLLYTFMGGGETPPPDANAPQQSPAQTPATPSAAQTTQETAQASDSIDIDELRASLNKDRDIFDYSEYRISRDVFRPLVGEASRIVATEAEEGEPLTPQEEELLRIADTMLLTGIIASDTRPMAIINQEIVYPGYRFGSGIEVESIEKSRVLLRVSDRTVALEMQETPQALEE